MREARLEQSGRDCSGSPQRMTEARGNEARTTSGKPDRIGRIRHALIMSNAKRARQKNIFTDRK